MILTCDDKNGGGYVFQFTVSASDEQHVKFPIQASEQAESMSECLRQLAEYAEMVEEAWRNAGWKLSHSGLA